MRHSLEYLISRQLLGKPHIILYARPDGSHAHASKECLMLQGEQFKVMGYKEITPDEAQRRKLTPCVCLEKVL